jgi:hypothetical protein
MVGKPNSYRKRPMNVDLTAALWLKFMIDGGSNVA